MNEHELARAAPELIALFRAAVQSGDIEPDRAHVTLGALHLVIGDAAAACAELRQARKLDRAGAAALFAAERQLAGCDARETALAAVSLWLDGGATCFEDVLEKADTAGETFAKQAPARAWPASQRLLRAGDFAGAARAVIEEAIPGAHITVHAQALRLRGRILPAWDGSRVDRLAVVFHHGLGDSIFYARYLGALRELAGEVTCVCSVHVRDLLAAAWPGVHVLAFADAAPALQAADAFAKPETLPHFTGEGYGRAEWLGAKAARDPYVAALRRTATLRAGVCWAGTRANVHDSLRSIPIAQLAPLFAVPGVEWHCLQAGDRALECPELVRRHALTSIEDTARLIAGLDLVLSVDTLAANLAGAMGAPVWALVESDPDFRWGTEGEGTPWYRSARVWRQNAGEGWSAVVRRAAQCLS